MCGAKEFQKEFDDLMQAAQDKAEYAAEVSTKDLLDDLQKRARVVGIKFGEFYDIVKKNGFDAVISEIERREKRRAE